MLGLFAWGRIRYDLVAALLLSVATVLGVVPADKAFSGFANPVIIIIAAVLIVGRAIAVSGVVEAMMRPVLSRLRWVSVQIGLLTGCVTLLSAFMKNVGTLGIFMPIAIQTAEHNKRSASEYLMPLSFGSLLGGTITLVGTSPNLLISTVREQLVGRPFQLFDFAPVGLPLSMVALAFLSIGWKLLPKRPNPETPAEKRFQIEQYLTEAVVPEGSAAVNETVSQVEALGDGDVSIVAIVREGGRRYRPRGHWTLYANDILVLRADPVALESFIDRAGLQLQDKAKVGELESSEGLLGTVEAVVGADSMLVGRTPAQLNLRNRFDVQVLAIGRGGTEIKTRLSQTHFSVADVILLQGPQRVLPELLSRLGCLPLAERDLAIGRRRPKPFALLILLVAMGLVALHRLPVATAFFIAAVLIAVFRLLPAREIYAAVDWRIIIMLGCLIPVGEALKDTGATALVGNFLTVATEHVSPTTAIAMILTASMLMTPFLHHAAAVLVMGPIAASVAQNLGYAPDPFLMAVALGASCDFLTPIGHQNNLLIMGPGGYRFGDYWRLGLPLSILVVYLGTRLIEYTWPVH
ncbi:MAG: SLC13 family permease [Proteobacteria bacterium]|nr:SLC13 family permease [Pseudomonadota bacterium]